MKYNRVPLNYSTLICFNRAFHYKPSSYWGTPIYGNLDAVLKPLPSTRTYAITSQRPPGQTPWIITRKAWENHGFVWKKKWRCPVSGIRVNVGWCICLKCWLMSWSKLGYACKHVSGGRYQPPSIQRWYTSLSATSNIPRCMLRCASNFESGKKDAWMCIIIYIPLYTMYFVLIIIIYICNYM